MAEKCRNEGCGSHSLAGNDDQTHCYLGYRKNSECSKRTTTQSQSITVERLKDLEAKEAEVDCVAQNNETYRVEVERLAGEVERLQRICVDIFKDFSEHEANEYIPSIVFAWEEGYKITHLKAKV